MAIVAGVLAGNPADTTLGRAIVAMIGCYFASAIIGKLAEMAIQDNIRKYKEAHPMEPVATAMPEDAIVVQQADEQPGDEDAPAARPVTSSTETRNAA